MRTNILFPDDWDEPIKQAFPHGTLSKFVRAAVKRKLKAAGFDDLSEMASPGAPVEQDLLISTLVLRHHISLDELSEWTGTPRETLSDVMCGRREPGKRLTAKLEKIKSRLKKYS